MTWRAKIALLGYTCFIILMALAAGVKIASSNIPDCQATRSSHDNATVTTSSPNACEPTNIDLDVNEPELFDDIAGS